MSPAKIHQFIFSLWDNTSVNKYNNYNYNGRYGQPGHGNSPHTTING